MPKVIAPRTHGVLDYLVVVLLALAPALFGFSGAPEVLARTLAGAYLFITLFTAFPLGVVKFIPFPVHGMIEAVAGVAALAAPWLFGFADDQPAARNFFVFLGAMELIVFALTDWRAAQSAGAAGDVGGAGPASAGRR